MLKYVYVCLMAALLFVLPTACKKDAPRAEAKNSAVLTIHIDPDDATFIIKGKRFESGTKIELTEGNYTIIAEGEGYLPAWINVSVKAGDDTVETISLAKNTGSALISSPESGVKLSLVRKDGSIEAGSSPLYVTNLEPGEYAISAEKKGFTSQHSKLVIGSDGMTERMVIQLENTIGYLELKLKPADAAVFVDNKEIAFNGQRLALAEGRYHVTVRKQGYDEQSIDVEIKRKNTTSQEFTLRQKPAKLSVVVKGHPDAMVKINGEDIVSPEKMREVPAGEYKIEVTKNFYDKAERVINLDPEQEEQVSFELTRNTGSVRLKLDHPGVVISMDGKKIGVTQPGLNGSAQEFLVEGLAIGGEYRFTFEHPYQFSSASRKVTIKKEKKDATLRVPFLIANATLKYKNGSNRISGKVYVKKISDTELNVTIPTKSGKGAYSEEIKSAEVIIDYLPEVKIDPAFKTSSFDLLAPVKE